MKMKILYLPCHSVHEYDEVRMFHEMGHEIFSPGAYFNPQSVRNRTRYLFPKVSGNLFPKVSGIGHYGRLPCLTKVA